MTDDKSTDFGFERVSWGSEGGDILFQRSIERRGRGVSVRELGFYGVDRVREAEDALRRMMAAKGSASP